MFGIKITKKILLLVTALFILGGWMKHPFYLSVADLKYNQKDRVLEGSVKIFTNDLEAALKKRFSRTIDLINIKDTAATKKILGDYLNQHFRFIDGPAKKDFHLLGFEREEEAIWLYLESEKMEKPKRCVIENSILYDHIKEQMNIVHLEVGGEKKSYKVTYPEKEMSFEFR